MFAHKTLGKMMIAFASLSFLAGFISCSVSDAADDFAASSIGTESSRSGISESVSSSSGEDKTTVMLQGFNWASPNGSWYSTISANASAIKNTFDYVWFPPASASCDTNGYLPTQLNNLNSNYGTETALKNAIQAIKPAKAIADIVINHRCGSTSWGDFTNPKWNDDYYSICSNDEGFYSSNSPMYGSSRKGNADTGEGYSAGRDLDHTNYDVQKGIVKWMNEVLKSAGFAGWRYDFVKGYSGYYVGKYNKETNAAFSVGEYWPSAGFSPNNSYAWRSEIENWINATASGGYKTRAFDFVLKGNLNYAFGYKGNEGLWDMTRLADSNNIFRCNPSYAVTFVDNHDTGSTQGHWPIDSGDLGPAYAFILTHPGVPCVAYQHYFSGSGSQYLGNTTVYGTSNTLQNHIKKLINIRKTYGICYDSNIQVLYSSRTLYAARIDGTKASIVVAIGGDSYSAPSGYSLIYSGTNFKIYTSSSTGSGSGSGSGTGSGSGSGTSTTVTKVSLKASYNAGMGNGIFFTGTFDEGKSWSTAVRGTWTSGNVWVCEVTVPANKQYEWKCMKGSYNLGTSVSTSKLTWERGSNHNGSTTYVSPSF